MERSEMLKVVSELIEILNKKEVSPQDAESIADIFQWSVKRSNEDGKTRYMTSGVFSGSLPGS